MVARAVQEELHGVVIKVARTEDLLIMKAVAGRTQDRADIEKILEI
ncbi:MAG: nucleotidyltransferase [Fimbriimonadaceae bacterium]